MGIEGGVSEIIVTRDTVQKLHKFQEGDVVVIPAYEKAQMQYAEFKVFSDEIARTAERFGYCTSITIDDAKSEVRIRVIKKAPTVSDEG